MKSSPNRIDILEILNYTRSQTYSELKFLAGFKSKNKRKKTANQKLHYLKVIKNDIIENKSNYPKISNMIDGINNVLVENMQKPVLI